MNETVFAGPVSVPAITSVVDLSEEVAVVGSLLVPGARRIRKSGFYNKDSRRPAGGEAHYAAKPESPFVVLLSDGTTAVASREGVESYAARTGQAVPSSL